MEKRIDLLNDENVRDEMFKYFYNLKFRHKKVHHIYKDLSDEVYNLFKEFDNKLELLLMLEKANLYEIKNKKENEDESDNGGRIE